MGLGCGRRLALPLLVLAGSLAVAVEASAFGVGGKVLVNVGGVNSAAAIVKASKGRLVLVGSTTNANFDFAVTRLLPSGMPDPSFAGDGTVETDLSGFDATDSGAAAKGNTVLLAGSTKPGALFQAALLRYTAGGVLDDSFSGDGVAGLSFPGGSGFNDVAVQRDGKIVAAGSADSKLIVARFKATGKLDKSFSKDGIEKLKLKAFTGASTVAVQRDGKVVVAGNTGGVSMKSKQYNFLARLSDNGKLDRKFGKRGVRKIGGPGFGAIGDVAIGKHGVIYGAGDYRRKRLDPSHLAVYSLTAKGSFNHRFSKDGLATTSAGTDSSAETVAIQRDGRILAGGNIHHPGSDWVLTRFTAKGKLDKSFSHDGIVTTDFNNGTDFMQGVTTLGKGRIAAAGGGDQQTAAAVYKRDGSLDG